MNATSSVLSRKAVHLGEMAWSAEKRYRFLQPSSRIALTVRSVGRISPRGGRVGPIRLVLREVQGAANKSICLDPAMRLC